MCAKLHSKTRLQNTILDFLIRFARIWFRSLKSANMTFKKNSKRFKEISKNAKFPADFAFRKKCT